MKKYYYLLMMLFIVGAASSFTACSSDDDNDNMGETGVTIDYSSLPKSSQQFIADYFDDYNVEKAVEKTDSYEVSLAQKESATKSTTVKYSGYEIKFDRNGNWVKIEGRSDSALPANALSLIPRSITSYVNQNYPSRAINEIEKETYGYKVELTGNPDVDLKFNNSGTLISSSDNNNKEQTISLAKIPAVSQTFVKTHFGSYTVKEVKSDDNEYKVKFTNGVSVKFDFSGNWKKVETEGVTLPASFLALLPSNLTNYINSNYSSRRIEEIEIKVSIYEVELNGDIDLQFDKDGNLWGTNDYNNNNNNNNNNNVNTNRPTFSQLPTAIQSNLNQYFLTTTTFSFAEKDDDDYEVKLKNGTEIKYSLAGVLLEVEVIAGNSVPDGVIPSTILSYVKSNYPSKKIEQYEKKNNGYQVELSGYPEIDLLFDNNYKFLGIDY